MNITWPDKIQAVSCRLHRKYNSRYISNILTKKCWILVIIDYPALVKVTLFIQLNLTRR